MDLLAGIKGAIENFAKHTEVVSLLNDRTIRLEVRVDKLEDSVNTINDSIKSLIEESKKNWQYFFEREEKTRINVAVISGTISISSGLILFILSKFAH